MLHLLTYLYNSLINLLARLTATFPPNKHAFASCKLRIFNFGNLKIHHKLITILALKSILCTNIMHAHMFHVMLSHAINIMIEMEHL